MKHTEIELKVRIENTKPLVELLNKKGKAVLEEHQVDEYFIPPHRDFTAVRPIKEWLRLRSEEGKYSINYKNWHYKDAKVADYCDEYETKISDIEAFKKIFAALDYSPKIIVDKQRKSWLYEEYEVSMDSVKGLGDFVEVEYKGSKAVKPETVIQEMLEFLEKLNLGKIKRDFVGYPFLLLYGDEK